MLKNKLINLVGYLLLCQISVVVHAGYDKSSRDRRDERSGWDNPYEKKQYSDERRYNNNDERDYKRQNRDSNFNNQKFTEKRSFDHELNLALRKKNPDFNEIKRILESPNGKHLINKPGEFGSTPIMQIAENPEITEEILGLLLISGADIGYAIKATGENLFHQLAINKNANDFSNDKLEIIRKQAIKKNIDLKKLLNASLIPKNSKKIIKRVPLLQAASMMRIKYVIWLIKNGANSSVLDDEGHNMFDAFALSKIGVTKNDINEFLEIENYIDRNTLITLVNKDCEKNFELKIFSNIKIYSKKTPIEMAICNYNLGLAVSMVKMADYDVQQWDIVRLLSNHIQQSTSFESSGFNTIIDNLPKKGFDVEHLANRANGRTTKTRLHEVVTIAKGDNNVVVEARLDVLKSLINMGARLNPIYEPNTQLKFTPLDLAETTAKKHKFFQNIVAYLKEKGAKKYGELTEEEIKAEREAATRYATTEFRKKINLNINEKELSKNIIEITRNENLEDIVFINNGPVTMVSSIHQGTYFESEANFLGRSNMCGFFAAFNGSYMLLDEGYRNGNKVLTNEIEFNNWLKERISKIESFTNDADIQENEILKLLENNDNFITDNTSIIEMANIKLEFIEHEDKRVFVPREDTILTKIKKFRQDKKPHLVILNVKAGSYDHWIALVLTDKKVYVADSLNQDYKNNSDVKFIYDLFTKEPIVNDEIRTLLLNNFEKNNSNQSINNSNQLLEFENNSYDEIDINIFQTFLSDNINTDIFTSEENLNQKKCGNDCAVEKFGSKLSKYFHYKGVHNKFICPMESFACEELTFNSAKTLNEHLKNKHADDGCPFVGCPFGKNGGHKISKHVAPKSKKQTPKNINKLDSLNDEPTEDDESNDEADEPTEDVVIKKFIDTGIVTHLNDHKDEFRCKKCREIKFLGTKKSMIKHLKDVHKLSLNRKKPSTKKVNNTHKKRAITYEKIERKENDTFLKPNTFWVDEYLNRICPVDECKELTDSHEAMQTHLREAHKIEVNNKEDETIHVLGDDAIYCGKCNKIFLDKKDLLGHLEKECGGPYPCTVKGCHKFFSSIKSIQGDEQEKRIQTSLNGHIKFAHKDLLKTFEVSKSTGSKKRKKPGNIEENIDENIVACIEERKTKRPKITRDMFKISDKNYKCTMCNSGFTEREALFIHYFGFHKEPTNECPFEKCHDKFDRYKIGEHFEKEHKTNHEIMCPIKKCGLKFKNGAKLSEHLQFHKEYDEKHGKYKCDNCQVEYEKGFHRDEYLICNDKDSEHRHSLLCYSDGWDKELTQLLDEHKKTHPKN